jgi:hypothetical protein
MPLPLEKGDLLEFHLRKIYSKLNDQYRKSAFEGRLRFERLNLEELGDRTNFYSYPDDQPRKSKPDEEPGDSEPGPTINYADAIEDLYQLITFLELHRADWVREHEIIVLEIKNLIYEIKDYSLDVPAPLGEFLFQQAKGFSERVNSGDVEKFADYLVLLRPDGKDYPRYRVLKIQIIAALCGVNHYYRLHVPDKHQIALGILANVETYVREQLPKQNKDGRESFGLLGLTLYLKGRLLSAAADDDAAQKAFGQSSDAYMDRLDQKSFFWEKKYISEEQYTAKKAVTLRRAALVSALGVGYLSFINGRISEALAALRASRGVLKQNVGAVYSAFVDILFYACRRAEGSSDRQTIDQVIKGLKISRETLRGLVPKSHYFHRAGLELATALHYRAKIDFRASDDEKRGVPDHDDALKLVNAAIDYSQEMVGSDFRNPRLLAEALVLRSYLWRRPMSNSGRDRFALLHSSKEDAERANAVAKGNARTRCEALIALGVTHYHEYQLERSGPNGTRAYAKLNAARLRFHEALDLNEDRNARIEAVCSLNLARINSYDPAQVARADVHFQRWKKIENRVEHAYCHELAREVGERLSSNGPFLIVNAETSLSFPMWETKLFDHLATNMLRRLAGKVNEGLIDRENLGPALIEGLRTEVGIKRSRAYLLVKDKELDLIGRLRELCK